jgi:hypothetical protein
MPDKANSPTDRIDSTPKHPRRALWRRILLPRFSLRTLIIIVTLFCLSAAWVGNWIYRSERQQRIVVYLNQFNTPQGRYSVDYDYDFKYPRPTTAKLNTAKPNVLSKWLGIDYFHNIVALQVNWPATLHPDYLQMLGQLTNLSTTKFLTLHIDADRFAEETFQVLDRLPRVERVDLVLSYKKFTSADAERLRKISGLKRLQFTYCNGEELHLPLLSGLNQLEEFSIYLQGDVPTEVPVGEPLLGVKKVSIFSHHRQYFNRQYIAAMVKMFPNTEHFEVNAVDQIDVLTPLKKLKSLKIFETYDFAWKWSEIEALMPGVEVKIWTD